MGIGETWISVNTWLLGTFASIDWRLEGGDELLFVASADVEDELSRLLLNPKQR
jgi:hypothetical protein